MLLQHCLKIEKPFVLTIQCLVHWTMPTVGLRTSRCKLITAILVLHKELRVYSLSKPDQPPWQVFVQVEVRQSCWGKCPAARSPCAPMSQLLSPLRRCTSCCQPIWAEKDTLKQNKSCKSTWIQLIQVEPYLLQYRKSLKQTKSIVDPSLSSTDICSIRGQAFQSSQLHLLWSLQLLSARLALWVLSTSLVLDNPQE